MTKLEQITPRPSFLQPSRAWRACRRFRKTPRRRERGRKKRKRELLEAWRGKGEGSSSCVVARREREERVGGGVSDVEEAKTCERQGSKREEWDPSVERR